MSDNQWEDVGRDPITDLKAAIEAIRKPHKPTKYPFVFRCAGTCKALTSHDYSGACGFCGTVFWRMA